LLVCLFTRSHSLVRPIQEAADAFYWGSEDAIECYTSILDRIGALIGEQCSSSCYREGVLIVVVFEISLSYVNTFHHRLQRLQLLPPGPTVRYAMSLRWL
jgi:hypothetical protein